MDPDVAHIAADPVCGDLITSPTDGTVIPSDICRIGLLVIQQVQLVMPFEGIADPRHSAVTTPAPSTPAIKHLDALLHSVYVSALRLSKVQMAILSPKFDVVKKLKDMTGFSHHGTWRLQLMTPVVCSVL